MHQSGDVNYRRAKEVRRTGEKILLAFLLYLYILLECDCAEWLLAAFAFVVSLTGASWSYLVLSGIVWEERFWQPLPWRRRKS